MAKQKKNVTRGVSGTIYDDVLRTIQERRRELLPPLINEIFSTDYPPDIPVTRLPEGYQKLVSKVVADSCIVIGKHVYHMEFQSRKDKTMILRMVEYDFVIGLSGVKEENGIYRIYFPRSCVIYLRNEKTKSDKAEMELVFQDGSVVTYKVPVIYVQEYSLEEIFEKKLYIYLPFYIMRYEKKLKSIEADVEKKQHLLNEYLEILNRFQKIWWEQPELYQDMTQLMKRVMEHQLRKQEILQKEVMDVMGGKVLPLPSDKLREERELGRNEGMERGMELGMVRGMELGQLKNFAENVESLMRLQDWSLKQACEALGSTEELYHRAKENMK